ncbi:MAG: S9 family peptidase [Chloroflexi bacterium]|nr:S9 family peptidase [Chloroflexota bacterium]
MTTPRTLPYGSWPSPITPELVVAGSRGLSEPAFDGEDVLLLEGRPDEGGRVTLLRIAPDGRVTEVTPAPANVRTRVHEYGGGAWTVADGIMVHSEFRDGSLVRVDRDGTTRTLVDVPGLRFADPHVDAPRGRVLVVQEDHRRDAHDPTNSIVAVDLAHGAIVPLVEGHDFVSHPRVSPDGRWMSWLSWERPAMPWDASQLWAAPIDADGLPRTPRVVAGGAIESIAEPAWAPDSTLVFATDRSGWWNLVRWDPASDRQVELAPMAAELAGPQWVFGLRTVGFDADGQVVAIARAAGQDRLLVIPEDGPPREVPIDGVTDLAGLQVVGSSALLVAAGPTRPTAVIRLDLGTGAITTVRSSGELPVDAAYLSVPRFVELPTTDGRTAFAYHYPPTNPDAVAPAGELPPLVVISHGGPTANTSRRLDLAIQAFTSRGFAVIDVDYGGSTGYGREYRQRLDGAWGVVDLDDCTNAATWLAAQGLADPARLVIRGGSAGGYTTLCAVTFRDVFAAGASYFGVGDLEALARDTHKFESRYLDRMVAPWPEGVEVYRERSPIHAVDRIRTPLLVLQGADDMVVPQAQADELVAALARNGVPHAYLLFQGEGHGFRRAENRRRSLEAELSFYAQVLGFELADAIEPIEVVGLSR